MTDRAEHVEAFYLLSHGQRGEERRSNLVCFESEDHFIAVSLGWRTRRLNHHEYCLGKTEINHRNYTAALQSCRPCSPTDLQTMQPPRYPPQHCWIKSTPLSLSHIIAYQVSNGPPIKVVVLLAPPSYFFLIWGEIWEFQADVFDLFRQNLSKSH